MMTPAFIAIGYGIISNRKTPQAIDYESDPSKFGNRLKEFFFGDELEDVTVNYLKLIDAGFNPKDAYEIAMTRK